jgi:hypothetical protein
VQREALNQIASKLARMVRCGDARHVDHWRARRLCATRRRGVRCAQEMRRPARTALSQ